MTVARPALVAFLGPSLPAAEARQLAPGARILPPAARGDLWNALSLRPRAIALIDGVFEARPAVWPREILAALEAGVAVFGAASMGALRAAELWSFGMVGLGQVFGWLRDGTIEDDSEVALLHAEAEFDHRPLTVPLVQVRAAAAAAVRGRVIGAAEGRALVAAGRAIFYQDRHWPELLAAAPIAAGARQRLAAWAAAGLPDPKAEDARSCLRAAAAFAAAAASQSPTAWARPLWPAPSALVQAKLRGGPRRASGDTALLAALADSLGVPATPELGLPPEKLPRRRPRENGADSARRRAEAALADDLRRAAPWLFAELPIR